MKCPNCQHEFDLHDLALDQDLRAILAVLPAFEDKAPLVLEYVGLFGTRPLAMKSAKTLRLLNEVKDLFERGRFTFQKCEFGISRAGIAEAMRALCSSAVVPPLTNHNYLKKVMVRISANERKARSLEEDKQHRMLEKHGRRPSSDDEAEGRDVSTITDPVRGERPQDAEGKFRPTKEMIRGVLKDIGG